MAANSVGDSVDYVMAFIRAELIEAVAKFPPMRSSKEGYAIIAEELDELWHEVKNDKDDAAHLRQRHEAVQVAAMAARFILDSRAGEWTHNRRTEKVGA